MFYVYIRILTIYSMINYLANSKNIECKSDYFILQGMETCQPYLGCELMDTINIIKRLGTGAVKDVFLINWDNHLIVLSVPINIHFLEDFNNGKHMLKLLNPSKYVVQLLGFCDKRYAIFTEYHPRGNAADFFNAQIHNHKGAIESMNLCYQYSLILNHLHHGPAGKFVFCDSNSLNKLLSQLLITSDDRIILNDVDSLIEVVNGSGIKCGHRQLKGTFVAPEQLWNNNHSFEDKLMANYNEKTDIWKAPDVCEFFLKKSSDNELIRYMLFEIHSKCKNINPILRPSSQNLVKEYENVLNKLLMHCEL